ncbi:hypothetical protein [Sulfitobacter sp. M368]|nr:hypothetical protein [Sulfitobacter sp. M368]UWR17465.1 hypothetical protein K3754_19420 [Sulfitobacter sp. M368]
MPRLVCGSSTQQDAHPAKSDGLALAVFALNASGVARLPFDVFNAEPSK